MKGRRPTQKEKTTRAYRAYIDLLDTAEWFRRRLRGQLETFDLTLQGFRLMEMMYREGSINLVEAAGRLGCTRQNMDPLLERLAERGWVEEVVLLHPPADVPETRLPKARRGKERTGCRTATAKLTPLGEKLIGVVLPKHVKAVKAFMRALDGRQQETLSEICRKLREGDAVKFCQEMMFVDEEESPVETSLQSN
jgi:hypothetical protein